MTLGELLTSGYERVYDEIRKGDMIRTLVGISEADDKWIGATLEDMGASAKGVEIWRLPSPSLVEIVASLTDHTTDHDRPFTGQLHTHQGERGKTEIRGLRFRDLADCVAKAWIDAASHTVEDEEERDKLQQRADDGTLNYNDLYRLECGSIDPVALIQSVGIRVEKLMGIFPNVPPLTCEDSEQ